MDLSSKVMLRVGLQLVGVITVINGVVQCIVSWGSLYGSWGSHLPSTEGMMPPWILITSIAVPLIVLGAGLYLLLGSKGLADRFYPDEEEKLDSARSIFILAMKVLGLVLIVQALPDAVQIITSFMYIANMNAALDFRAQSEFFYNRLLSTLLRFAIGYYLLVGGQLLLRLAFPVEKSAANLGEAEND